ncbi:E3 ubiquitin-protein ligase rnf146 [Schistocerca americana]|uniref:E3 ubiquitin-protein ligase rnf146 n=1 Tax=Schistocerca americana TaxID=7009 RepID=UPI001F4FEC6C|nr:E3 ubiquitin-protein ligase rnf146 [Schistocerca americana]XP_047110888.1 E3 ubiquitin-protein ligase rnf146 [Schistocerca piceifrons]XP_049956784.1 E3 ubiquitin-protein ligase rnf146 [Schistocerca serialis cubense]
MAEGGTSAEPNKIKMSAKEEDKEERAAATGNKEQVFEGPQIPECAVCLQTCIHPAQLPCGHIFCFLCVKGVANQSRKCAMCRQEIPPDYLEKPQLVEVSGLEKEAVSFDDGYQWFYEGRNGWWQYDERTSHELETAYKKGERICELLIAGFLYVADFDDMLQVRQNDPSRRRRIKRDLATIPKKGVAGLRLGSGTGEDRPKSPTPQSLTATGQSDGATTPVPPTNTPQTPAGGATSGSTTPDRHLSLRRAIEQIRILSVRHHSSSESSGSGDEDSALPDLSAATAAIINFSSNSDSRL